MRGYVSYLTLKGAFKVIFTDFSVPNTFYFWTLLESANCSFQKVSSGVLYECETEVVFDDFLMY